MGLGVWVRFRVRVRVRARVSRGFSLLALPRAAIATTVGRCFGCMEELGRMQKGAGGGIGGLRRGMEGLGRGYAPEQSDGK